MGEVNGAGRLGPTSLIVTSSMEKVHVEHALSTVASRAEDATKRSAAKDFTMSDAEVAFREGLCSAHGSSVLMCWFHVTKAVKDWVMANTKMTKKLQEAFWLTKVKPDIDCLHRSLSPAEFDAKSAPIF